MDRFILEIPNFVSPDLCKELTDRFQSIEHTLKHGMLRYEVKTNKFKEFKKPNLECNISKNTLFRDLDSKLSNRFATAFKMYIDHLKCEFDDNKKPLPHTLVEFISINNAFDRGFHIQKIKPGSIYEWHVDSQPCSNGTFIQFILYLNTLELDEGGTTEFANGRKVRPEIGKLLIFPCSWTFPHSGNEVKCKDKFIITTIFDV